MPDPLPALEAQRDDILRQMARIGDMRKGSITETFRCCGKPICACYAAGHPGHGPYYAPSPPRSQARPRPFSCVSGPDSTSSSARSMPTSSSGPSAKG